MASTSRVQTLLTCAKAQERRTRIFHRLFPAGHETKSKMSLWKSSLTPFFVLWFVFRRVRKTGKTWEHLSHEWCLVDARWTWWGRCPTTSLCVINHRASFLPVKLITVNLVNAWGPDYRWRGPDYCWRGPDYCWRGPDYRWSAQWWSVAHYLKWMAPPPYVYLASIRCHSCDRH